MNLAEYEELLADMIARDKLTIEQAQKLRQMFMNGDIREDDLPLPLEQAKEKSNDIISILAMKRLFLTVKRTDIAERKLGRNLTMQNYEAEATQLGTYLGGGLTVNAWHTLTRRNIALSMYANWLNGNGTDTEPNIDSMIDEQLTYLYRFAGEQSAMSLLGTPFSEEYTVNRSLLYGGAVWASWFYGNESVSYDDGYVAQYIAVDDGKTCNPCMRAVGYYRINEGVMPGQVCYGGSRCRCERIVVYAPDVLARL